MFLGEVFGGLGSSQVGMVSGGALVGRAAQAQCRQPILTSPCCLSPSRQAVLQYHPGLEFLADTPEFQARYAETVIYRIFYTINRGGGGRMTYRELRRSDLLEALFALEREEDINRVTRWGGGVTPRLHESTQLWGMLATVINVHKSAKHLGKACQGCVRGVGASDLLGALFAVAREEDIKQVTNWGMIDAVVLSRLRFLRFGGWVFFQGWPCPLHPPLPSLAGSLARSHCALTLLLTFLLPPYHQCPLAGISAMSTSM